MPNCIISILKSKKSAIYRFYIGFKVRNIQFEKPPCHKRRLNNSAQSALCFRAQLKTIARAHAQNWRPAIKATIVARRLWSKSHDRGSSSLVEKPRSWLIVLCGLIVILASLLLRPKLIAHRPIQHCKTMDWLFTSGNVVAMAPSFCTWSCNSEES